MALVETSEDYQKVFEDVQSMTVARLRWCSFRFYLYPSHVVDVHEVDSPEVVSFGVTE